MMSTKAKRYSAALGALAVAMSVVSAPVAAAGCDGVYPPPPSCGGGGGGSQGGGGGGGQPNGGGGGGGHP
jgi:hypothetical protein